MMMLRGLCSPLTGACTTACCAVNHYMMRSGGITMSRRFAAALCALTLALSGVAAAEIAEVKIPKGAGGIGFLPLLVMEQQKLIEKHAAELGNKNLKATFVNI